MAAQRHSGSVQVECACIEVNRLVCCRGEGGGRGREGIGEEEKEEKENEQRGGGDDEGEGRERGGGRGGEDIEGTDRQASESLQTRTLQLLCEGVLDGPAFRRDHRQTISQFAPV